MEKIANLFKLVWIWLRDAQNASGIQVVASIFALSLTAATIYVLYITWRAINQQALATEEQIKVSKELIKLTQMQTVATESACDASKRQVEFMKLEYEQKLAPLLVVRFKDGQSIKIGSQIQIRNVGAGAAFKVTLTLGRSAFDAVSRNQSSESTLTYIGESTIGPGDLTNASFAPGDDNWMTLRYLGADRNERYTLFTASNYGVRHEHWVRTGLQFIGL